MTRGGRAISRARGDITGNLARLRATSVKDAAVRGFRPSSGFGNPLSKIEKLVAEGFELEQPVSRLDIPSVETMLKYQGYLKRQESDVQRRSRDEHRRIPREFRYAAVPGCRRKSFSASTRSDPKPSVRRCECQA